MSDKLVSFISNGKIECIKQIKELLPNATVISMIGESRRGKSVFMNCIISKLHRKTMNVFDFKSVKESEGKDCTNGIDYYVCNIKDSIETSITTYIFLDVQGIGGLYSASDPAVLLFIYEISDLVIVNSYRTINNNTLQLLSPISSLANKISKKDIKPKLVFRVFDSDEYDEKQAIANFNILMEQRNDQVEAIRSNIRELFDISADYIIWTETPSKKQKASKDLMSLINDKDLLFGISIDILLSLINNTSDTYDEDVNEKINSTIREINALSVSGSDFDSTGRYTTDEMLLWMGEHDDSKPSQVQAQLLDVISITDGTQAEYDIKILPKIITADITIKEFKKEFVLAPKNVFDLMLKKLTEKIYKQINLAVEQITNIGCRGIYDSSPFKKFVTDIQSVTFTDKIDCSDITENQIYGGFIEYLITGQCNYCNLSCNLISNNIKTQMKEIKLTVDRFKDLVRQEQKEKENNIIDVFEGTVKNIEDVLSVYEPQILLDWKDIREAIIDDCLKTTDVKHKGFLSFSSHASDSTYSTRYNFRVFKIKIDYANNGNIKIKLLHKNGDIVDDTDLSNGYLLEQQTQESFDVTDKVRYCFEALDKWLNVNKDEFIKNRLKNFDRHLANHPDNICDFSLIGAKLNTNWAYQVDLLKKRKQLYDDLISMELYFAGENNNVNNVCFIACNMNNHEDGGLQRELRTLIHALYLRNIDVFKLYTISDMKKILHADALYSMYEELYDFCSSNRYNLYDECNAQTIKCHEDRSHITRMTIEILRGWLYESYKSAENSTRRKVTKSVERKDNL